MCGAQHCLGVWELLENVLIYLPPTDLTRVMRVASLWKEIRQRSVRLRHNHVLVPFPPETSLFHRRCLRFDSVPQYPPETGLRINCILRATNAFIERRRGGESRPAFQIDLWQLNTRLLKRFQREFVTFPPCQRVLLSTHPRSTICTVYVKDGIRIGDLVDMGNALSATDRLESGRRVFSFTRAYLVVRKSLRKQDDEVSDAESSS